MRLATFQRVPWRAPRCVAQDLTYSPAADQVGLASREKIAILINLMLFSSPKLEKKAGNVPRLSLLT